MKTHFEPVDIERGDVAAEGAFTIKATAKAFDILSSGLYSDKIGAVVRELSCNAHDSHVAAGKGDVPIEICLPSVLEPTFYVKDFGLGMSHEDVMMLYTTYFESTKTSSDDFIGQLGLGSKSPFSYASTFIVESVFNGTKRQYSCFKNEVNMPAIAQLSEEATDECNGMKITLAVRRDDCDKFAKAARKSLMYFKPAPNIVGNVVEPYSLKHTVRGNGWRIRDTDYYAGMRGAHVVQGFVAYPIDSLALQENGLSPTASALTSVDIDMFVDIGQVEVAASREALQYDKRTVTNLIGVFEAAAQEMRVSFQAEFDKCKSAWEVALMLDKLENQGGDKFKRIFKDMHKADPFQWNGADATTTIKLDLSKIKSMQIQRISVSKSKKTSKLNVNGSWHPQTATAMVFEFSLQSNVHVVYCDDTKPANEALKSFIQSKPELSGRSPTVIAIRPIARGIFDQREIDAVVKALGSPAAVEVKGIPYSQRRGGRSYTPGQKRAKEQRLVFTNFQTQTNYRGREEGLRRTFSRLTWETREIDIAAGGFFVQLERFTPIATSGANVSYIDNIIRSARKLGLIDDDVVVVGMNEKELASSLKQGDWVDFFAYVKKAFNKANKGGAMYSRVVADAVFEQVGKGVFEHLVQPWAKLKDTVLEGDFKAGVQALSDLHEAAGKYDTETVRMFTQAMAIHREADARVEEMPAAWKKALRGYEMLALVNFGDWNTWVKPVINYVNQLDAPR